MINRFAAPLAALVLLAACGSDPATRPAVPHDEASTVSDEIDDLFPLAGGRRIHLRCVGTGEPTLVLEGGDEDGAGSYDYAMPALSAETRTCVYDRANLGTSDPDRRRRGLRELVSDLEQVLAAAHVGPPYVLVGTSGGGYIRAGFAYAHRADVAGMVFVEVPAPFRSPPPAIIAEARWDSPQNVESRDYLRVEKDAWAQRRPIGRIPFTVISNEYSAQEIASAEFASEARGMRANVEEQRGWFRLSPRARQIVVHTGHAVDEVDPELVVSAILDVLRAGRID